MSISISIDNDRVAANIQPLIEDESLGIQTPAGTTTPPSTDTGNELDVTLTSGTLGGFQPAFNTFLNGTLLNGFVLTGAQKTFAATNDGASSSADFVKVTTTNNETISDLFFSDAQGAALDGDQVVGMQTLDNQNVYLWSNGDFCIATTSATAGAGRIVAAFYLKDDAVDHKTAQVQMVTFEPLKHLNTSSFDEGLNFTDVLKVSAAGTISFNFDSLPSGNFLWTAVGSSSAALLITGQDLNVIDGGPKNGDMVKGGGDPSDSVNTSQAAPGTIATIGVNSQHFADQSSGGSKIDGPIAVCTLVNGYVPLATTAHAVGINVSEIDYANYINAPSAKILISQATGSSSIGVSMKITLWEAGGGDGGAADHATNALTPEEGYGAGLNAYIGNQDTDSNLKDDWAVAVGSVTVQRGASTFTFTGAGGTQGGVTVTISGNSIVFSGLQALDTIGFAAADTASLVDGTFNRFDIQCLANSNAFDIGRIDLAQGVSVNQSVGDQLVVQDDGIAIAADSTNAPSITDDETTLNVDNHANYAGNFTVTLGTDGAGATPRSYALSTSGGASGVTDTATGHTVFLFSESGQIVGRQGTDATAAASGDIVFVISVDQTGEVTLDQQRAVIHDNTNSFDESRSLTGANKVVLTATAFDGDGDHAAANLDITTLLNLKDDGPSITADATNAPSITDDETTLGVDNHANYAGNFSPTFGADGQGATPRSYALSTSGGASGVTDTATGHAVFLFSESGQIVGRQGTDAAAAATGDIVFVVSVSQTGEVTLDQRRAIVHANPDDPDETRGLTGSNKVVLTGTANDGDGDHASAPLDLTALLNFKDDGPSITASAVNAPSITDDETTLGVDNHANYAGNFTPVFGNDGQGATPRSYALSTAGGASGVTDTATGHSVFLFSESGQIVGREGVDAAGAVNGAIVFVVSVSQTGEVTLDQQRAVIHDNTNSFDESRSLTGLNKVVLTATAFDGDGDHAAANLDITTLLNLKDDGIAIVANATGAPSITDDESDFSVNNSANYAANFTVTLGADGAGATPRSYSLSTPGGNSGLIDTASTNPVFLFKVGDNIVGKAGADATAAASGPTVFVVSIDQTGQVTLDQQRAVVHVPNTTEDQSTTLSSAGLVVVNATAFDGDGDHASDVLNIGQLLNFKDDAPRITAQILGGSLNFVSQATVTHSLNGDVKADVITNANSLSQAGTKQYTITGFTDVGNLVFPNLDGVLSADGTKVTYYSTNVAANQNSSTAVYELTLNQTDNSGAGSYTFKVLQPPPIVQTNFTFTDLPSGQNLFGIIAQDKADLSKGGLLVIPSNPVLDANGMFTNASGTINTSKGGGPVTIGNANQAFDNAGEGAYFMYVDDPTQIGVGGLGLTATNADDADTISFNGTNQATRASVTIVQASGSANKPGPALQIHAYEANPGNVDSNSEARNLVNNPTVALSNQGTAAPEVNIIGVKIHDATGAVIEYATLNQATGAAVTQDINGDGIADNSPVGIAFNLANDKGTVGTADDVYFTTVSNLKAKYTVEFITATDHNLALVQNVSGSYDIGGFNIFKQSNLPAQDFHFSVQITDYDNDPFGGPSTAFANFDIHINDLIFP